MKGSCTQRVCSSESGAALVTVILVSLLLGTACIAMLSAVSASSRNGTDALSEYKAYYAAESGLQASIDIFRNKGVSYSAAVSHPTLAYDVNTFPAGLTYTSGKVVINSESSYAINVTDPDNSARDISYTTVGSFLQADGITYASTRVFGTGSDTLTISYHNQGATLNNFTAPTAFGSFGVVKSGNGATNLPSTLSFRVDFVMSDPRAGTRTIRGTICTDGSVKFDPKTCGQIQSSPPTYSLMGSTITLCNSSVSCAAAPALSIPAATTVSQSSGTLYGAMTAINPYRLKITATGNGPNGARKELEGIIQRNFFNDLGSSAAIAMVGPNASFVTGTSAQMQISGGSVPAVTVSDAAGLASVTSDMAQHNFNGTITPAPEIASSDVPDWQQSTYALDALIQQLRQTAQNSGRYFTAGPGSNGWGNFSTGTGLTFCEGNCGMSGNDQGGGILVVTGTFTTSGSPKFNGLVLVVGPGGVVRSGGGNEIFTGNIVIAPYDPNNLAAGFLQPKYNQLGGPGDTINSDVTVDSAFDGTSAITDFMLGVAEK